MSASSAGCGDEGGPTNIVQIREVERAIKGALCRCQVFMSRGACCSEPGRFVYGRVMSTGDTTFIDSVNIWFRPLHTRYDVAGDHHHHHEHHCCGRSAKPSNYRRRRLPRLIYNSSPGKFFSSVVVLIVSDFNKLPCYYHRQAVTLTLDCHYLL